MHIDEIIPKIIFKSRNSADSRRSTGRDGWRRSPLVPRRTARLHRPRPPSYRKLTLLSSKTVVCRYAFEKGETGARVSPLSSRRRTSPRELPESRISFGSKARNETPSRRRGLASLFIVAVVRVAMSSTFLCCTRPQLTHESLRPQPARRLSDGRSVRRNSGLLEEALAAVFRDEEK